MTDQATPAGSNEAGAPGRYVEEGEFTRDTNYIEDRILRDGSQGWPVEAGRYRLVAARACPWANRSVIVRRLLGLEDAISLGLPGPTHDARSWTFDLDPDGRDPVLGTERLQESFFARFPDYPRGITVPALATSPRARSSPTTTPRSRSTSPPSGPSTTARARPTSIRSRSGPRSTRSPTSSSAT